MSVVPFQLAFYENVGESHPTDRWAVPGTILSGVRVDVITQQNKLSGGEKRERQKDLIKNVTTIPYLYVNI